MLGISFPLIETQLLSSHLPKYCPGCYLLHKTPLMLSACACYFFFFPPNIILHLRVVVFKSCHHWCTPSPTDLKSGGFFDCQINCWARLNVFQNRTLTFHDCDCSFWAHQMLVLSNRSKDPWDKPICAATGLIFSYS